MDYNDNVANPVLIDRRLLCIQGAMFNTVTQVSIALESKEATFSWAHVPETFRPQWEIAVSGTAFMDAL